MRPLVAYSPVTGESNLISTVKSVLVVCCIIFRALSSAQRSWSTPCGTVTVSCEPLVETVESPLGSITCQVSVFSSLELNSSESNVGRASVWVVISCGWDVLPCSSVAVICRWYVVCGSRFSISARWVRESVSRVISPRS